MTQDLGGAGEDMGPIRRAIGSLAIALCLTAFMPSMAEAPGVPAKPLTYYGGPAGRLTMARDELGGNPFASGLVDVLERPGVRLREFGAHLAAATWRRSRGNQSPEAPRTAPDINWSFDPKPEERRIALVLANADYSASGAPSLPGAEFDLKRVSEALRKVGFETQTLLDADQGQARQALEGFARASSGADVSLIYIAGHGVQHRRMVYWLMGDFPEALGAEGLDGYALSLDEIRSAARAGRLNLIFYSACRNDPFPRS